MLLKAVSLVMIHLISEKKICICCFKNGKLTVRKEIKVVRDYGIVRFSECIKRPLYKTQNYKKRYTMKFSNLKQIVVKHQVNRSKLKSINQ